MLTVSLGKSPLIWSICPLVFWQKNSRFLWTIKENRFFFLWVNFAAAPESGAESVLCFSSGRAHGAPPSPGTEECLCQNAHFGAALMNEAVTATTLPRWGFLSEVAAWLRPSGVTETLCANDGLREFERRCFSHPWGRGGAGGAFWLAGEGVCWPPDAARGRRGSRARWW